MVGHKGTGGNLRYWVRQISHVLLVSLALSLVSPYHSELPAIKSSPALRLGPHHSSLEGRVSQKGKNVQSLSSKEPPGQWVLPNSDTYPTWRLRLRGGAQTCVMQEDGLATAEERAEEHPGAGEQGTGDVLEGLYTAKWSPKYKAGQLTVSRDGHSVYNPYFSETTDMAVIYEAWSVRADTPLPRAGRHYFEVSISQEDKPEGLDEDTLEEGWNTIGLVAAGETNFKGWWWRDSRRMHTFGIHDSMQAAYPSISSPEHEESDWARGAAFGDGDRVGLLVDMDLRICHIFKNDQHQGIAFRNLPDKVYPLVTLLAAKTTAILHTTLGVPEIDSSRPLPKLFGYEGAPGMRYGQCKYFCNILLVHICIVIYR